VLLGALLRKAQFSILASQLIAVYACLAKAVEVAFFHLFSANDMGNELSKAGITKGGSVIFGPPRNDGVFFPLFATLDAFYAQFFVVVPHVNLNMLQPMSRDDSVARLPMIKKIASRKNCQKLRQNQVWLCWVLQVKEESTSSRTIVIHNSTSRYSVSS
jgi:hypothetical protein